MTTDGPQETTPGNQIAQRQNEEGFLHWLAAQRQIYDEVKRYETIWWGLAIAVAFIGSGAVVLSDLAEALTVFFSLAIAVGGFWSKKWLDDKRKDAAAIQELFDCELLRMSWNELFRQRIPNKLVISRAVTRFEKRKDVTEQWSKLRNWYSLVEPSQPLYLARVACQLQNLWWNQEDRRDYLRFVSIPLIVLLFVLAVSLVFLNLSVQQTLVGPILLFFPLIYGIGEHLWKQKETIVELQESKALADELWLKANDASSELEIAQVERDSRALQDLILRIRGESSPIPSWFYRCGRPVKEKLSEEGAYEPPKLN